MIEGIEMRAGFGPMTWREYRADYLGRERQRDHDMCAGSGPVPGWCYIGPPMVPTRDRHIRRAWLSHVEVWRHALTTTWRNGFEPSRQALPAWMTKLPHVKTERLTACEIARILGMALDDST